MNARRRQALRCALAFALLALLLAGPALAQPSESDDSARSLERPPRALEHAPPSFEDWMESLPEGQRRRALRRLGNMPEHRRDRFFRRWEAMEEGERRKFQSFLEERAKAIDRGERPLRRRLEQMSPESREKLAPLVRRWRDMGPGERRKMRQRLERFRMLSPEDQEALIEKRFQSRSPEERARILDALREASKALPERPFLEPEPGPIAPEPTPKD